ncbi:hypothetical protein [Streptomyces antimycoticus]
MRSFEMGQTVVRRDVYRSGRVWSEHALRVVADTSEALVDACPPGAETRWPALYVKARAGGDRSVRMEAFDAMASGVWELAAAVWQRRRDVPAVPLFRRGDLDVLLHHPAIDWTAVRATPRGRPSPLARLTTCTGADGE